MAPQNSSQSDEDERGKKRRHSSSGAASGTPAVPAAQAALLTASPSREQELEECLLSAKGAIKRLKGEKKELQRKLAAKEEEVAQLKKSGEELTRKAQQQSRLAAAKTAQADELWEKLQRAEESGAASAENFWCAQRAQEKAERVVAEVRQQLQQTHDEHAKRVTKIQDAAKALQMEAERQRQELAAGYEAQPAQLHAELEADAAQRRAAEEERDSLAQQLREVQDANQALQQENTALVAFNNDNIAHCQASHELARHLNNLADNGWCLLSLEGVAQPIAPQGTTAAGTNTHHLK